MSAFYTLKDWFVRNRGPIGGVLSTIGAGIAAIDPQLIASYPRASAYVVLAFGLIFGAGAFKSDEFQRDKQGK